MLKFQTCSGFSTCCLIAYRDNRSRPSSGAVPVRPYSRSLVLIFRDDGRYTMHVQNSVCSTVRYQYTGGVYVHVLGYTLHRPNLIRLTHEVFQVRDSSHRESGYGRTSALIKARKGHMYDRNRDFGAPSGV